MPHRADQTAQPSEPASTVTGHASSSSKAATAPRYGNAMTATSSCHEGSSIRTHEPSRPEATVGRIQRSHPWGLISPLRMSNRQRLTQSQPRGRSTLATTIPSDKEAPSPTHSLGTTATPSHTDARGLATPQAMTTSVTTPSDTSVSHVHFDFSLPT